MNPLRVMFVKIHSLILPVLLVLLMAGCQSDDNNTDSAGDSAGSSAGDSAVDVAGDSELSAAAVVVDPDISTIIDQSTVDAEASAQWPAARFATAGVIEHTEQRPGDAAAGRRALLEEAYVSCGLPERVFRELLEQVEVVEITGRSRQADGLPYDVNLVQDRQGTDIVTSNCLSCHATPLFGELVVGLGNEFMDFTADLSSLTERAGSLVSGDAETAAWELYADRIAAIAPYMRTRTVGVNPANNLTFALIAHRHAEDNAWSADPLLPMPPRDPPPVSVPPWWRMAKKSAMFNMGEGRRDHARIMMAASMLCSDTRQELEAIDAFAPDMRAYISSLKPPRWPFDIDDSLAAQGQTIFEANCSACHGTYGEEATYPSRLVPLDVIQTDGALVEYANNEGVAYIDWFNRSYYGELSTAAPGPGYVAPPLDGIWATAPFLHNGSVPSVRTLLDSSSRPASWSHVDRDASRPESYDQQNLGWSFKVVTPGEIAPAESKYVYDTSLPGYTNTGHRFGDHLSDAERTAVIEYLKTL